MATSVRDALRLYNAKRDFRRTAEPAGRASKSAGNIFIVQKHAATRLHYDFRLELDGVLKSWAVTRGPSLDPKDKRLAVMTEDHPLGYATFEGTIPKGEYGGGTVMLWDRGTWEPLHDPHEGLKKGKLHFRLSGERMKGEWVLFRLKGKPGERRENWLLRKVEDEHAGGSADLVDRHMTSIKTGRGMADIASGVAARRIAPKRRAPPAFRPVQLATLVDTPPAGDSWLHEVKYDGYRCLLAVGGGQARAYTRNGNDWSEAFADIVAAASGLEVGSALIDGEVVALDDNGMPSFSTLQNAIKGGGELLFFAFDLLEIDGTDITHLPLTERKARLKPLIEAQGEPLMYAEHIRGGGEDVLGTLCRLGYEGIVSKKADGKYAGKRSGSWLKVKCTKRQEFVIVGWRSSEKGRRFSSLLLGYHDKGELRYVGRVGTGFDMATIADIADRLEPLAAAKPAATGLTADARRGAHWVKPQLVAEIAYTEMTPDGILRHPSFLGLRLDKPAAEVGLEKAVADTRDLRAGVAISNPDRVMFPEAGITKADLVGYYEAVAEFMLPHVANRPLSLVRCPQGRGKQCFFQKHDSGAFPEGVRRVDLAEADGKREPYIYVDDLQGLVACLQMGALEFHGWGSRVDAVERPDRLVFDLDPDAGLGFDTVVAAAFDIRKRLKGIGLESWPMLSGGKGAHVVVPLRPEADWPAVKRFARRFAEEMAAAEPARFTATMSKAKRQGRIFIDWLRNQRGATAVMPYSTRARPGAPIAMPLSWAELKKATGGGDYRLEDVEAIARRARRLKRGGWAEADQRLPAE